MKGKQKKIVEIDGEKIDLSFRTVDKVFAPMMKSKKIREAYEKEVGRLNLIKQIRETRLAKKLTQEQLAKKADMPQSVIARIESGRHSFSLATLYKIAKVFDKQIQLV